jgi:hypothetical protein
MLLSMVIMVLVLMTMINLIMFLTMKCSCFHVLGIIDPSMTAGLAAFVLSQQFHCIFYPASYQPKFSMPLFPGTSSKNRMAPQVEMVMLAYEGDEIFFPKSKMVVIAENVKLKSHTVLAGSEPVSQKAWWSDSHKSKIEFHRTSCINRLTHVLLCRYKKHKTVIVRTPSQLLPCS